MIESIKRVMAGEWIAEKWIFRPILRKITAVFLILLFFMLIISMRDLFRLNVLLQKIPQTSSGTIAEIEMIVFVLIGIILGMSSVVLLFMLIASLLVRRNQQQLLNTFTTEVVRITTAVANDDWRCEKLSLKPSDEYQQLVTHFNQLLFKLEENINKNEQAKAQNVNLLTAERAQRELAETLQEVTRIINNSLNQEKVLSQILEQLARVVLYDSASVMLIVNDSLRQVAVRTVFPELKTTSVLKIAEFTHLQEVIETKAPLVIENTTMDLRWNYLPNTEMIRCWMGVPLIVNGRVIGLLNLTKQQTSFYGLQHINIVIAFANQAASAIENARLYDQMKAEKQKLSHRVLERTKELAEANEQLKVLDRLKTKFVNDVSHELSTPVGNIQLYLGLIKEGQPEKQASYIATLSEQVNRLEKLIKSILDLSRLDVDTVRPKMAHVNIIEMVTPIVTSLRLRAENVGLSFDFHSNGHQPLVLGDLNQLTQVVTNLVMNAINYTNRGCVNILINYDEAQHQVYLVVKDTGIGIAQKDLPYLFDRFYRGQAVSQANYPGTGLGLAIVKEIVDKHGGQVGVESVLGEGSTFQVALPCVRVL